MVVVPNIKVKRWRLFYGAIRGSRSLRKSLDVPLQPISENVGLYIATIQDFSWQH